MNKILLTIWIILTIISFAACQDSLGIDPEVRKSLIIEDSSNNGGGPGKPDMLIPVDSVMWNFMEFHDKLQSNWSYSYSIEKHIFLIDTTSDVPYIKLDIEVHNFLQDLSNYLPYDIVSKLEIKIDSLPLNTRQLLNTTKSEGLWCAVEIMKAGTDKQIYKYDGRELYITIETEWFPSSNGIQGVLQIYIDKNTTTIRSFAAAFMGIL